LLGFVLLYPTYTYKFEARNPKQIPFWILIFGHLNLFRISNFGFRVCLYARGHEGDIIPSPGVQGGLHQFFKGARQFFRAG